MSRFQLHPSRIQSVVTNPVIKEGITDVFSNSGHSLNIVLRFLVALGTDAIVQHVPGVPDLP